MHPRPIGLRIPRPYETEDDFIRGDGLAIGRLGMILIGAPARPPGITVRFEVMLKNGEAVFRGEGRVVAHRVHANGREGLEVRFTRLDSRSKTLVEQVLKLRKSGMLTPSSAQEAEEAATRSAAEAEAPDSGPSSPQAGPDKPVRADTASDTDLEVTQRSVSQSASTMDADADDAGEIPEITPEPADAASPVEETMEASPPQGLADVEPSHADPADEVLDEDPTPFAPPVSFDAIEAEASEAEAMPEGAIEVIDPDVAAPDVPAVEVSADTASALSKLRRREGRYETPDAAGALLDRLRERARQP